MTFVCVPECFTRIGQKLEGLNLDIVKGPLRGSKVILDKVEVEAAPYSVRPPTENCSFIGSWTINEWH